MYTVPPRTTLHTNYCVAFVARLSMSIRSLSIYLRFLFACFSTNKHLFQRNRVANNWCRVQLIANLRKTASELLFHTFALCEEACCVFSAILWWIAKATISLSIALVTPFVVITAFALVIAVFIEVFIASAEVFLSLLEIITPPLVLRFYRFALRPPVIIDILPLIDRDARLAD